MSDIFVDAVAYENAVFFDIRADVKISRSMRCDGEQTYRYTNCDDGKS